MTKEPRNEIQRLQTLLETVRLLNSTLELKELTEIILEVVRAEVAVERMSVFVIDRARNCLRPLVAQEMQGEEISLPLGVGIAGTVAVTGETLDIPNAYADPRFERKFDGQSGFYTNDLLAMPVCNRDGQVVAVLELLNRLRPITPEDREFLLGISVYIGLALENSLLHSQVFALEPIESAAEPSVVFSSDIQDLLAIAIGYLELTDQPAGAARLLEHAKQQGQQPTVLNLSDELRRIGELRAVEWEHNKIAVTLVTETVPPVCTQEYELRLILVFLIRTAEAAALRADSGRQLRIHSWCIGKNVHVSIHHKACVPSVMTPGVAVANSILRRCQGQIRFESTPEQGTTFLIELPAHQESQSRTDLLTG